jgi:radical SAM protein with 4Fe4S-binding SPASM domain
MISRVNIQKIKKLLPQRVQNAVKKLSALKNPPIYKNLPLAVPVSMHIDPCNLCNFRCVFCPTGDVELTKSVNRFKGMMSKELFFKIIDDCEFMTKRAGKKIKLLHLYKDGEPLLNRDFISMAKYAKDKNVADVVATTSNGSLLTEELSSALILTGIDSIRISIEHINDSGYERITKTFSDFNAIKSRIHFLYKEKKRQKSNLKIIIKINDSNLSTKEKKEFIKIFRPLCDEIKIDTLMGWSMSDRKDFTLGLPVKTAMNSFTPLTEKNACPEPFSKLAINADGTVSVCCVDWSYATVVGDIKNQSLYKIWHGKQLNEFRIAHLSGRRSALLACADCQYLKGFPASENIDEHTKQLLDIFQQNWKNRI